MHFPNAFSGGRSELRRRSKPTFPKSAGANVMHLGGPRTVGNMLSLAGQPHSTALRSRGRGTRGTHDKVRDTLALYNMESVRLLSAPLGPSHAAIPSSIPSQHSTVTQSHTNARSTPIQVSSSLRLPAHSSSFIHFLPRASLVASPAVSLNSLPPARGRSVVNNRGWRRARTRAR